MTTMNGRLTRIERRFVGTTMRPTPGQALELRQIATCQGCGVWRNVDYLDGDGNCRGCQVEAKR